MKDPTYRQITEQDASIFKYEFDERDSHVKISGERDVVVGALLTSLEFRPHCIFD